jgi:hypothetical protein
MIASFATKFTALNRYAAPPAGDYGNYLTQVDILNGYDVRGQGLRYNPLFYALLDPFLIFFDSLTALKIVASLVFSTATIPFFLLAKKLSNSYLAALITSWTFLFFEGYSEMIGWGGNPNFLGFSFMLLTLFFLVKSIENPSNRNILLTGFSLSLVVGAHFLVTAFALLFLLVFAVLTLTLNRKDFGRNIKILLSVISVSAVLSLPYSLVYVTFVKYSSSDLIDLNLLKALNAAIAGLEWMFRDQYLIVITMTALGIFALLTHAKENRNNSLILCSLLMLPFVLALLTENPDRWFYFLPIPVMLSFALFLGNMFVALRHSRKVILLLASCFVLLILIGGTILSVNRLEGAVDYYQSLGNDEIQALNWVKENTFSNATFATSGPNKVIGGDWAPGNSYSWWIEGLSKRKSLHTGFTTWYTYEDERLETAMTNRIFAGNYVFEFNDLRISDNFPADSGNPQIAVLSNGQYQNVLFLNDAEEGVTFSPAENQQAIWNQTPFYAENKTMNIDYNENWANATFSYNWSGLELVRSIIMNSEQSYVDVIFELVPANSILRQFTLNFWTSFSSSLESYQAQGSNITLHQKLPSDEDVETRIAILDTNGAVKSTQVFLKDPKYSLPLATYSLTPLQGSLFVHVRISITTQTSETKNSVINFYNSYDMINESKIDYIFLNKDRANEYGRFVSDSEHFKIVFENALIVIFKVASEEK